MTIDACKQAIKECIAALVAEGTRKANIEIELIFFIKRELYKEGE
jgi:hypothetical protein